MVHAKQLLSILSCYLRSTYTQYKYLDVPRVNNTGHTLNPLELFYIRDKHMGNNEYTNKQDTSRPFQLYA
jgi:hypothetical protein